MSEFLLNPCRQGWLRPTTRQEQEILEIYGLRENRQLLVKMFGEFWGSSIRRDKPEPCSVDSLTAFLDIRVSDVTQSHGYGPSRNPECYLRYEFPVLSFKGVHERFQRPLNIFRLEANHGGRITHVFAEVHAQGLSGVYEERFDNGP